MLAENSARIYAGMPVEHLGLPAAFRAVDIPDAMTLFTPREEVKLKATVEALEGVNIDALPICWADRPPCFQPIADWRALRRLGTAGTRWSFRSAFGASWFIDRSSCHQYRQVLCVASRFFAMEDGR